MNSVAGWDGHGSPVWTNLDSVRAEPAQWVRDVDAISFGRTALWQAVAASRPDNAGAQVAAGADPWREMMRSRRPRRAGG